MANNGERMAAMLNEFHSIRMRLFSLPKIKMFGVGTRFLDSVAIFLSFDVSVLIKFKYFERYLLINYIPFIKF